MGSDDNNTSDTMPASAGEIVEQAITLHEQNRLAEAEALYTAALSLESGHAGALTRLGLLRLQQNRPQESATLLRRAIEQAPDSAEAHSHLGAALQNLGSHEAALASLDRALALAPESTEAMRRRAHTLHALGRGMEAIAGYETLLAIEPANGLAQLGLATVLAVADREEEAFVRYRNAAGANPALIEPLSHALAVFAHRHPGVAQAAMGRINQYIGMFLTNHANPRMGIYPGLTSAPFHDPARLPGALALERDYAVIRAEVDGLAASAFQPEAENRMGRTGWDIFPFYERGRKNEENCARCPTITRVIEGSNTVRTMAGLLYVSKLKPGMHIEPHTGPTNLRLRCHLGIRIPDGDCGLTVGGETRRWQEGKCLVFDDSLEHEAWNRTLEPRIVLIVDLWHPDLTPAEITYLEGLHRFASYQAVSLNRYWTENAEARSKMRRQYD
ncbi:aspartyl/asparaginyl beta-hydroxylase domain-containing protein [Acidisphaera sp. S103]|uniref:aspartyl/asparaginyl beta-hydroxylase domain-containing protein n=1 Tax=Acidisphaera sp. S103 TaxID=1747223 RepID=UPI00131AEE22|nr:aspartyl/asparaginyl beta-hydroxylase domain-containing protein [Acidisphaera sp. S103]